MEIKSVSNTNFTFKSGKSKKFLTPDMQKNVQQLLRSMNQSTEYKINSENTVWVSNVVSSLNIDNKCKFIDYRNYKKPVLEERDLGHDCTLKIGSSKLDINSVSGEIIRYKRCWYKTWPAVFKQAEDCLRTLVNNFSNQDIVKRGILPLSGYTAKGLQILKDKMYGIKG